MGGIPRRESLARTPPTNTVPQTGTKRKDVTPPIDQDQQQAKNYKAGSTVMSPADDTSEKPGYRTLKEEMSVFCNTIIEECQLIERQVSDRTDGKFRFNIQNHVAVTTSLSNISRAVIQLQMTQTGIGYGTKEKTTEVAIVEERIALMDMKVENLTKVMSGMLSKLEAEEKERMAWEREMIETVKLRTKPDVNVNDLTRVNVGSDSADDSDVGNFVRPSSAMIVAQKESMRKKRKSLEVKRNRENEGKNVAQTATESEREESDWVLAERKNKKRTYANITAKKATSTVPRAAWKPPEKKNDRFECSIRMEGVIESDKVMNVVKNNLKGSNVGGLKGIWGVKGGRVVIEGQTAEQIKKVTSWLAQDGKLRIDNHLVNNPMVRVIGVAKGFTKESIVQEIIDMDDYMQTNFLGCIKGIKAVTSKPARNPNRENWILEVPPEVFRYMVDRGHVVVDFVQAPVAEHLDVATCYKCCRLGHVAKHCRHGEACGKCAGEHQSKNCTGREALDCVNCKRAGLKERRHSAFDKKCPVYARAILRERERIAYG